MGRLNLHAKKLAMLADRVRELGGDEHGLTTLFARAMVEQGRAKEGQRHRFHDALRELELAVHRELRRRGGQGLAITLTEDERVADEMAAVAEVIDHATKEGP